MVLICSEQLRPEWYKRYIHHLWSGIKPCDFEPLLKTILDSLVIFLGVVVQMRYLAVAGL